jgi:hypothetical protein
MFLIFGTKVSKQPYKLLQQGGLDTQLHHSPDDGEKWSLKRQ